MTEQATVEQEIVTAAATTSATTTATEKETPVAVETETLIGEKKETPLTEEQKTAQAAETKRLLESKDEDLSAEDKVKKTELVKAQTKEQEDAKAKIVPEKYELKAPEGMTIDMSMLEKLTPVLKEAGITNAVAQKLSDAINPWMAQQVETARQTAVKAFDTMVGDWRTETIKSLGADYQKEMSHAAKWMDKYGDDDLRSLLDSKQTGLGNNLVFVRAIIKAGKALGQDSLADSGHKQIPMDTDAARASILYPTESKK